MATFDLIQAAKDQLEALLGMKELEAKRNSIRNSGGYSTEITDVLQPALRNGLMQTENIDVPAPPLRNGLMQTENIDIPPLPLRNGLMQTENFDIPPYREPEIPTEVIDIPPYQEPVKSTKTRYEVPTEVIDIPPYQEPVSAKKTTSPSPNKNVGAAYEIPTEVIDIPPYQEPVSTSQQTTDKAPGSNNQKAPKGIGALDQLKAMREDIQKINEDLSLDERIMRGENPLEAAAGIAGTLVGGLKQVPTVISKDIFGGIGKIMEDPVLVGAMKKFSEASGNAPVGPVAVPKPKGPAVPKPEQKQATPAVEQPEPAKPAPKEEPNPADTFKRNGNLRAFNIGGKVVFSNYDLPEDKATGAKPQEIDYQNATGDMRRLVRKDLGLPIASGAGSVSTIQGTDEMIRDRATRDAMMKNAAAEATMTEDEKFKRKLEQAKQLGQAQGEVATANKIADLKKLTEVTMGTIPPEGSPVFEKMKAEIFDKWRKDGTKAGIPDQKLWEDAHLLTRDILQREASERALRMYLIQNKMLTEPSTTSDVVTPNG